MYTPRYLTWGTEESMAMECLLVYDRLLPSAYVNDLTYLGMKDICQSDSHLCRLLMSSWSLVQSEDL